MTLPPRLLSALLGLVVASWLLYPLLRVDHPAADAIPFVVAGELAHDHPDDVYLRTPYSLADVTDRFRAHSCPYFDTATTCADAVGFVSPPPALPVAVALARAGDAGPTLLSLLGVVGLAAGMVLLWRAAGPDGPVRLALLAGAVALWPLVERSVSLGQTSPALVLVVVGPAAWSRSRRSEPEGEERRADAVLGLAIGLLGALKGFPLVLLAVAALLRRWRVVAAAAAALAVLAVATLAIAPLSVWGDFLRASSGLSRQALGANPYNGAIEGAVDQLGWAHGVAVVVRVALVAAVVAAYVAARDPRHRWALASAGAVAAFPQVWSHYAFVGFAAVALAVVARPDRARLAPLIALAGLLTVAPARLAFTPGRVAVATVAVDLACLALVAVLALARPDEPGREPAEPAVA